MPGSSAPRVRSLHRYPVKSLLGEDVPFLDVDGRGCAGDRLWSVRTPDGKLGSGKHTRRFVALPGLLELRAQIREGRVHVTFPQDRSCLVDDADATGLLSDCVGQQAAFAFESDISHFDDGPISLVGGASVGAVAHARGEPVDPDRFRGNLLLETAQPFVEDTWVGRRLCVGTAVLQVSAALPRCVMVDQQTADLPAQPGNLKAVGRLNNGRLGVVATVVVPGRITVGDAIVFMT